MDTKVFLSLIFMISVSYGKLDESMFGAQGSELLKELKESGVIDQFEQELEKMLHQQKNAGETNEIIQGNLLKGIDNKTDTDFQFVYICSHLTHNLSGDKMGQNCSF